ncbi:MAG TPA: hypothetical protein VFJ16_26850 [Longimicrobium sp.]|nr:hypothetical protein [Longimicrobium sp.]
MRPELWVTLAGLMGSLQPVGEAAETLLVDRVELDLPMEITFHGTGDEVTVLGSPPRWRWETAFDRRPGRLRMVLQAEPAAPPSANGEAA